jgi:hypothetical protein
MPRVCSLLSLLLVVAITVPVHPNGKLIGNSGGNEREAVVYSPDGLEAWAITGPDGRFEFSLKPGEYVVSCGGRIIPYVRIRDGETTTVRHADDPEISLQSELWTPACLSFGQTYTALGTAFTGVSFWMPSGSTKLKLILRENGPQGRLIGEVVSEERHSWITSIRVDASKFPTTPGRVYYVELASTEGIPWTFGTPKRTDPYPGGMAYYDGVPRPESDLGITIYEVKPGLVTIAAAQVDQHFIEKGPGSGTCKVAGQSFVAKKGKNVISVSALCGFGGGVADFVYSLREDGPDGRVIASKVARMVSDWGSTVYFEPDEVMLEEGRTYYFEYKRVDGRPFYSYLSADVYPEGKAYRDGQEVPGFDQMFEVKGEVEPGGVTFPYNVKVSDITSSTAKITWETGTEADGIVEYGDNPSLGYSLTANVEPSTSHTAILTNLKPATVYYYRVASFTGKEGAGRAYGHIESFMTSPAGEDKPSFDKPEAVNPIALSVKKSVLVVNGSFEEGLKGWQRCSSATPKKYDSAEREYPIGSGPFGKIVSNEDGYKPHSGRAMYGWKHLGVEDPNPILPREDWKQEVVYQKIKVVPGQKYILKAWVITGDRESGWGRDSRVRLVVDTKDEGLLESTEKVSKALATQWFATENEWMPITLRFTAEKDTAVIGVHILQWWALEANYTYIDDIAVEEAE